MHISHLPSFSLLPSRLHRSLPSNGADSSGELYTPPVPATYPCESFSLESKRSEGRTVWSSSHPHAPSHPTSQPHPIAVQQFAPEAFSSIEW